MGWASGPSCTAQTSLANLARIKRRSRVDPSSARRETDFVRPRRQPHYRLRIGEVGVFYDVSGSTREILAIVAKSAATSGLGQFADPA